MSWCIMYVKMYVIMYVMVQTIDCLLRTLPWHPHFMSKKRQCDPFVLFVCDDPDLWPVREYVMMMHMGERG